MAITYDAGKLVRARVKRRWTQTELAKRAGLTRETVSKIEDGRGPWIKAIGKMEKALGIRIAITAVDADGQEVHNN